MRKTALSKMVFSDAATRHEWERLLQFSDLMSSDESGKEADEDVIFVHKFPWRSQRAQEMLDHLDDKHIRDKTPLARRQTKKRLSGPTSTRPRPTSSCPSWALVN